MKRQVIPAVAIAALFGIALLSTTSGCKKSSSSGAGGQFSATYSGQTFTPNFVIGAYSRSEGIIALIGYKVAAGDTTSLEVDIPDSVQVNEPSPFAGGSGMYYLDSKTGTFYNGDEVDGSGLVTLSSWDTTTHTLSGTFSGNLYGQNSDSLVVTNGHFNTTYTPGP